MDRAHCLIDDITGRGFLCLDYEGFATQMFEITEVEQGVRLQATHDLDPLVRLRLRDLGPLSDASTMLDCIRLIDAAKTS